MRAWAGHAVFAAVLIGSLAAQERAADPPEAGASLLEPAILHDAASHGLKLRQRRTAGGNMPPALVFEAPGCSLPVQVSPRLSNFEEESLMDYAPEQGYTRRYLYFDRSWDKPAPRAAFLQRMKYWALAMFGLTDYTPSRYLILVETPKNCQSAEAVDWRPVWKRDYLAGAKTAPAQ